MGGEGVAGKALSNVKDTATTSGHGPGLEPREVLTGPIHSHEGRSRGRWG